MKTLRLGIVGAGLMGREMASAIGRWLAFTDVNVGCEITAVCDVNEAAREWFRRVPSVKLLTADATELFASPDVDAVYIAVPHNLHERLYVAALEAGKDLFAEKPFGIDLAAAQAIRDAGHRLGRFVRCSSEFPFLPGAQRAFEYARSGAVGRPLEIRSGFHHASDLDPTKPANWKRLSAACGEIGVLGDLGMHALHLPLRLGWRPRHVFAQLQKGYPERPDGKGGTTACDTWDNAMLHTSVEVDGHDVPMRIEMKRLAPSETNTWFFEYLGTDGGVRYSTKEPKTLWIFERGKEQAWRRIDLGMKMPFGVVTGGIFEPGFADCFQQMVAAFALEWAGELNGRFGCVTPDEAVASQEIFAAALESQRITQVVKL